MLLTQDEIDPMSFTDKFIRSGIWRLFFVDDRQKQGRDLVHILWPFMAIDDSFHLLWEKRRKVSIRFVDFLSSLDFFPDSVISGGIVFHTSSFHSISHPRENMAESFSELLEH